MKVEKNVDLNHLEAKQTISFNIKYNTIGVPEIISLLLFSKMKTQH